MSTILRGLVRDGMHSRSVDPLPMFLGTTHPWTCDHLSADVNSALQRCTASCSACCDAWHFTAKCDANTMVPGGRSRIMVTKQVHRACEGLHMQLGCFYMITDTLETRSYVASYGSREYAAAKFDRPDRAGCPLKARIWVRTRVRTATASRHARRAKV